MTIQWTRNPRQGFVPAHWRGKRHDGVEFKIEQKRSRVRGLGTKAGRVFVTTYLTRLPVGKREIVADVADAKYIAEFIAP